MSEDAPPAPVEHGPASRSPAPEPPQHRGDLWIGFFGTIFGNVLLLILLPPLANTLYGLLGGAVYNAEALAPWVINIGALLLFATVWSEHRRIALGMLLAYGVALGLALVAGILLAVLCFGGNMPLP